MALKRELAGSISESVKRSRHFELSNKKILKLNTEWCSPHYLHYEFAIESLEDIIALDNFYTSKFFDKTKSNNLPFFLIHKLRKPIDKLLSMVGIEDVKSNILYLIVFYLQKLDAGINDMLHTVVYGGPGVGKTMFIGILAEIYANLGILPTKKVTFLKRADLVGQYLGHTAIKTKAAIEEAKGGILVIDEAYALGDSEQKDSFSRECLDTLNQFLSEDKREFVCIIAGYKEDIETRFFKTNPGLRRRFPFKFTINDYSAEQLRDIFCMIVKENNWKIDPSIIDIQLIKENKDLFKFNGGDMEVLFTKTKFIHSMRVFSAEKKDKKLITKVDFEMALKQFVETNAPTKETNILQSMYM
jgi:AAA+ superfamily predicted ATPase